MSRDFPIGRSLALNLVVALGLNIAWLVVVFWVVALASKAGFRLSYEALYVRLDGVPLLYRYNSGRTASYEMLTLDGQPSGGRPRGTQGREREVRVVVRDDDYGEVGPRAHPRLPRAGPGVMS